MNSKMVKLTISLKCILVPMPLLAARVTGGKAKISA